MNYGRTELIVCESYQALGKTAARDVADVMRRLLSEKAEIRVIFAAAESQATFFDALTVEKNIDWSRVVCLNLDEFWGPDLPESVTCRRQVTTQLYFKVHPKSIHMPAYNASDVEAEAARFTTVFNAHQPIDILCQGIGRSGHLALNEPGVTSFDDLQSVRVVEIVEESRRQLGDDPNFRDHVDKLKYGITLTIPALMSANHRFTMVPLVTKRPILERLLALPAATEALPASILREYAGRLYMDRDSCPAHVVARGQE